MKKHLGRNDQCPCGSGKKYKYCCISKQDLRGALAIATDVACFVCGGPVQLIGGFGILSDFGKADGTVINIHNQRHTVHDRCLQKFHEKLGIS